MHRNNWSTYDAYCSHLGPRDEVSTSISRSEIEQAGSFLTGNDAELTQVGTPIRLCRNACEKYVIPKGFEDISREVERSDTPGWVEIFSGTTPTGVAA